MTMVIDELHWMAGEGVRDIKGTLWTAPMLPSE